MTICTTHQRRWIIVAQALLVFTHGLLWSQENRSLVWPSNFQVASIISALDGEEQLAYWRSTSADIPQPLLVSLHSWSADYTQRDPLASMADSADWNYIHPDFRGPNRRPSACCSQLVIADIDQAISYARQEGRVDSSQIYVVGSSGGGYATLAMFMKSRHPVSKFCAWVPISDLVAWYDQSLVRKNKYAQDILDCTGSDQGVLNIDSAMRRSPLYWPVPSQRLGQCTLEIYAGVLDGIQGSVPITQSINFYNLVAQAVYPLEKHALVSDSEKLKLLEHRKPLGDFGMISGRDICLQKGAGSILLTIFDGNHEMLPEAAFATLIPRPK